MRRPSITSPCVADRYHGPGERIAEVSFPNGAGCLLSLRMDAAGVPVLEVYRTDGAVRIITPPAAAPASEYVARLVAEAPRAPGQLSALNSLDALNASIAQTRDDEPRMECRCGDIVPLSEYLGNDRWGGCCDSCARRNDGEGAE